MIPLISKNATVSRRIYLQNKIDLIDFSEPCALSHVSLDGGLSEAYLTELKEDIVSVGDMALTLKAAELEGGDACHDMSFTYSFDRPIDMRDTPTLTFAFSSYGGDRDSQYFSNVKENMYFVEKPDPLLISESYITLTLISGSESISSTAKLTDYGFNRILMNFSGQSVLKSVEKISFRYEIFEKAKDWQRIMKLDTVSAGMEVDLCLHGSGMERLFSASLADITHKNGVLHCECRRGAQITLPDLTDAANTVCDIFLPVKNTMLLRMDADVDELMLKVSFMTDGDTCQREENIKTFEVKGLTLGKTLFLDLSDCIGAHGTYTDKCRLTRMTLSVDRDCTLNIHKIAFEQEKPTRKTGGRFLSCTADKDDGTITFSIKADPSLCGCTVRVFDGFHDVTYDDKDTLTKLECVGVSEIGCDGCISMKAGLYRGNVTRICSSFIGSVEDKNGDWIPLENRISIENWKDICEGNPYSFDISGEEYDVTDSMFGAKGDGYSDDTRAIQVALDLCRENGGRVILPDTDGGKYGRRYVVTNLRIYSNTELYIAKNAVLWQSDDASLYSIPLRFGHNVSMTGVNWPANHSSGNYPLIYAFREENVKITGGGTVRMADIESRSVDGLFRFIGDNVCIGCKDRIHVVPIGLIECENIEVTDISIIRSSAPFMIVNTSKRLYVGNVTMDEAKCTGADGMWPCGSDGVVFERIMMNTNDDGICLSANYNDPRDMLWYYAYPGWDHGTHNLALRHSRLSCYTFTGSAISFCIWGTDSPDLSRAEVNDIELYDTCLEGRLSIGGWTDNPYYGISPFDGSETDDFSPVKNLKIHKCELRSPTGIDNLRITNLDSDCGLYSPSQFEYGDFKRRIAEQNEGWVTGLSNWSYSTREALCQIELYGKPCASLRKLRGKKCDMWQGLQLCRGKHTMRFAYKAGGEFIACVRDKNGELIADMPIYQTPNGYSKGKDWQTCTMEFSLAEDGLYRLGIEANDSTVVVYATDFTVD